MIVALVVAIIVVGLLIWLADDSKRTSRVAPSDSRATHPPAPHRPAPHPPAPQAPVAPPTPTLRFQGRGTVAPRPPQTPPQATRPTPIFRGTTTAAGRFRGKVGESPGAICVITLRPVSECTRGNACEC